MKLLVIGGTRFSGRALTERALARGHEVTVFHRGQSGADLFPEADHVLGDREEGLDPLEDREFDAVVDTCGYVPRSVGAAVERLGGAGWYGFISSISAYADFSEAGMTEASQLHAPPFPDTEEITESTYGPLKVACEERVTEAFGDRAALIRPGYIVGPNDPTDRFTYWLRRAATGGEMIAPAPSDQPIQFVDARDLAAFVLRLAEAATGGVYNVVHPRGTTTLGELLERARGDAEADTAVTWADGDWLGEQMGEDKYEAFPLWVPEEPGSHLLDPVRAVAAGLDNRPVAETVRDTLAWDRTREQVWPMQAGLAPDREAELIAAWAARG
ncbi:MAG: NAD-dependent epimerase/dehydratase family protein [Actinomycetota bacterium]